MQAKGKKIDTILPILNLLSVWRTESRQYISNRSRWCPIFKKLFNFSIYTGNTTNQINMISSFADLPHILPRAKGYLQNIKHSFHWNSPMCSQGILMNNSSAWISCGQQPPVSFDFEQKSQWFSLTVVEPGCTVVLWETYATIEFSSFRAPRHYLFCLPFLLRLLPFYFLEDKVEIRTMKNSDFPSPIFLLASDF